MKNPFEVFATTFPYFPDAICASEYVEPDWWFPENLRAVDGRKQVTNHALELCKLCPHVAECLKFAVDNGIVDGIWGGEIMHQKLKTEHEYSKPYLNYQQVKKLLSIGFTVEKACEEVGIKLKTFERYSAFEKEGWKSRPMITKHKKRSK